MKVLVTMTGLVLACAAGIASAREFDCMIEPAQVVEVRSPVVGLIEKIHVQRGSIVKKGDSLVTIDSGVESSAAASARFRSEAVGAVRIAEAKFAAATEKAQRNQSLFDDEFVSAQARDDAEAERRVAEAELRSANENAEMARLEYRQAVEQLNRRVIRSSIDGVVMDRYLHSGSLVDSGEGKKPILKIAQISTLQVESVLQIEHYRQVKAGVVATVIPEPPLGGEYQGTVKTVDRVIDSASGTFGVVVELQNKKQEIPAGVRCKIRFASIP